MAAEANEFCQIGKNILAVHELLVYDMVMLDKDEIAAIRKTLRMTAAEFGKECGVTGNTVARWELGIRFPSRRHMVALNAMKAKAERLVAFMALEST